MIMDQFHKWKIDNDYEEALSEKEDEDLFTKFTQEKICTAPSWQVMIKILFEIYSLQCCMEGVLEDMEYLPNGK